MRFVDESVHRAGCGCVACFRNPSPPAADAEPDPDRARRRWLADYASAQPFMGVAENPAEYVPLATQQLEQARESQRQADLQLERDRADEAERERLARAARNAGATAARERALESARQANAAAVVGLMSEARK
ncbi:hypothetical protein VSR82_21750 [Burkholderia sp. JPY481]